MTVHLASGVTCGENVPSRRLFHMPVICIIVRIYEKRPVVHSADSLSRTRNLYEIRRFTL